ncbi:rhomboid family protein [bacterium BMS3Bbin10]|nr:rhomboid family protein [bacterium BMS3Bbin10]
MFPISDDNPSRVTPVVTWGLIAASVLVFLWQASLDSAAGEAAVYALGMIPARLFGFSQLSADIAIVPAWATIFTSMFMHGGWMHLGGNMLFLWIFGDNVEDAMGHFRFAVFYLICGAAAALTQGLLNTQSVIPMVGASGAISGVLGAYLLLYPRATVRVLLFLGIIFWIAHVPAMFVLGVWFLGQLVSAATAPPDVPGVAFWAHVGGFVAGMVLVPLFKDKYVPLWQTARTRPFDVERRRGPWG